MWLEDCEQTCPWPFPDSEFDFPILHRLRNLRSVVEDTVSLALSMGKKSQPRKDRAGHPVSFWPSPVTVPGSLWVTPISENTRTLVDTNRHCRWVACLGREGEQGGFLGDYIPPVKPPEGLHPAVKPDPFLCITLKWTHVPRHSSEIECLENSKEFRSKIFRKFWGI